MKEIKSISFIGSGNVATNLAIAFSKKGIEIKQIFSKTIENAKTLAKLVNAESTNNISQLHNNADLYIVALKDDSILEVLSDLPFKNLNIVHTSGSFHSNLLEKYSTKYGCIYPMQTFNKINLADMEKVNFFLEASNKQLLSLLENLVKKISSSVNFLDSNQREKLHIAAIGVNNFTHFILAKSKEFCSDNELNFNYLENLLNQTIQQLKSNKESLSLQTGPAKRGDINVLHHHLEILKDNPNYKNLYKTINQLILTEFHGEKYEL